MTKHHDQKVAAAEEAEAKAEQKKEFDEGEKRLKKAESKISTLSKAQAAAQLLEGKD